MKHSTAWMYLTTKYAELCPQGKAARCVNRPAYSWLNAQAPGNCRCVQQVCEDIWQISTQLFDISTILSIRWQSPANDKQVSGVTEVWERNPPKMCHTSVLGFKVSNSAAIQFGCNLKSNDVTIYLHRATARWASEWQMIKRVMIRSFTTAGRSKQATPLGLLMKPQQSLGTDWNESVSKPVSCLFQSITFNSIYPSIILPSLYMMVPLSSAGAVMQHKRQRIHPGQALVYRN